MNIFFDASPRGKEKLAAQYKKIYQVLEDLGYDHLSRDVIEQNPADFYEKLSRGGKVAEDKLYNEKNELIRRADINIFECTVPGLGLGFVILKSIELGKPTVVLYYKDAVPHFLLGMNSDKLFVRSYSEKNIATVLKKVISQARIHREKRFNFFISPKLLSYLETEAKKQGITKSMFIRNLLVEHMHTKNKDEVNNY